MNFTFRTLSYSIRHTELEHGKVKAPVLAKLHDQDEVGCADDQLVLKEIIETRLNESQVAVLMTTSEDGT